MAQGCDGLRAAEFSGMVFVPDAKPGSCRRDGQCLWDAACFRSASEGGVLGRRQYRICFELRRGMWGIGLFDLQSARVSDDFSVRSAFGELAYKQCAAHRLCNDTECEFVHAGNSRWIEQRACVDNDDVCGRTAAAGPRSRRARSGRFRLRHRFRSAMGRRERRAAC